MWMVIVEDPFVEQVETGPTVHLALDL